MIMLARSELPAGLPVSEARIAAAQTTAQAIADACAADHHTGSLRCTDPHHLCHKCWQVAAFDIAGGDPPCPDGEALCVLMQREIPRELPAALATYYSEEVLGGYTAGLARRVCMDFGACVDSPWMGAAGASFAVAHFMAEMQAYGGFFHETSVYLGQIEKSDWAEEARTALLHECTNKARGVAQAGTALTFGSPRPDELEQAHEELLAVAMQMERDLLAIQEKCGGELDRSLANDRPRWVAFSHRRRCVPVMCSDSIRAIIYGVERFISFNKTLSLREAHTALAPFAQYASGGGHEAVEDLLLLLSLTFEDYALSLEPGAEPTQGAVAYLLAMVVGLPVTMLRLTALIAAA